MPHGYQWWFDYQLFFEIMKEEISNLLNCRSCLVGECYLKLRRKIEKIAEALLSCVLKGRRTIRRTERQN